MTHAIDVQKLRKRYGDRDAVRDVSFSVDAGEVFCLLGPNVAGKTTTTEILEGYRLADSGTVRVLGHDPAAGERRFHERIGIVLQECGVQADLSVAELVRMYGRYYPRPRPVDELLDLVGLTEKRNARAKTLSGGQKRRLDLALGLVGDPEVLFLDEPPPAYTRRPAAPRGRLSATCAHWARRSSAPPTSWTRPRSWPTASPSSPAGRSWPWARRTSSGA